jgi:hypothetical protein
MARLIGIRESSLKPGVSEGDFARFVVEECLPAWRELPPGWQVAVLKGVRGDRVGNYIIVDEFDSEDARNRHFPPGDRMSGQMQRWLEAHSDLDEKRETYATTIRGGLHRLRRGWERSRLKQCELRLN